ncbi:MAG TPA: TonB family protein [Verrucomicrobiae bacterium]
MERLQKKCLVGSLASHGILVVVLAVATAFGEKTFKPAKMDEQHVDIKLIDIQGLTDGPSQQGGGGGGGSPAAVQAPAPAPAPRAPEPEPEPEPPKSEPVAKPPVEIPKPQPIEAVVVPPQDTRTALRPPDNKKKTPKDEPKKEVKADAPTKREVPKQEAKKVAVNLNSVTRTDRDAENKKKAAAAADKARKEADAQAIRNQRAQQAAIRNAIGNTFDKLNQGLSQPGEGLDIASFGVGSGKGWGVGNGPTLMNYAQYVREIYDLNWIVTEAVTGDAGIVRVEIVVQRNGAARGRIIRPSGNTMLDRSVQKALDNVKNIGRPFPEGATDSSRTFTINFNLTSKRGTG